MKSKRYKIISITILLIAFVAVAWIASKNRQMIGLILLPNATYKPTEIPDDTTALFEYDGYIKSDPVYIYVQGGPNWELFDREQSPFAFMPHSGTYVKVFPYQAQILNHTILAATPFLTAEQAQHEVAVSAEILYRTISYFKNRNKKVYVFCISHGSQIGLEMLRNSAGEFDGLALTMIRLAIEKEVIEMTHDGKVAYYNTNQELESRYLLPSLFRFSRLNNRVENMTMLMKVCRNDYTELLQDKDLSKVVYVYGKYDNKVGYPKPRELAFLEKKGVSVLELGCGHDDLGNRNYIEQINQLLIHNRIQNE